MFLSKVDLFIPIFRLQGFDFKGVSLSLSLFFFLFSRKVHIIVSYFFLEYLVEGVWLVGKFLMVESISLMFIRLFRVSKCLFELVLVKLHFSRNMFISYTSSNSLA